MSDAKKLMLESLAQSGLMTKIQEIILRALMESAQNFISTFTVKELSKIANTSRQTVYSCLNALERKGLINRILEKDTYRINKQKLNQLLEAYKYTKNISELEK